MFTGLVEEVGRISSVKKFGDGRVFTIQAKKILDDLKIDHSVSVEGVCQTVVSINGNTFEVVAVKETLRKTNFATFEVGQAVNLERAVRLSDRLGGHIVQGHVDTIGKLVAVQKEVNNTLLVIEFPQEYKKWVIPVGSVCLNGVSLTVARVEENRLTVAIIPHTLAVTTIGLLKIGDEINIEFDVLGKYIENILKQGVNSKEEAKEESLVFKQFLNQPEL